MRATLSRPSPARPGPRWSIRCRAGEPRCPDAHRRSAPDPPAGRPYDASGRAVPAAPPEVTSGAVGDWPVGSASGHRAPPWCRSTSFLPTHLGDRSPLSRYREPRRRSVSGHAARRSCRAWAAPAPRRSVPRGPCVRCRLLRFPAHVYDRFLRAPTVPRPDGWAGRRWDRGRAAPTTHPDR